MEMFFKSEKRVATNHSEREDEMQLITLDIRTLSFVTTSVAAIYGFGMLAFSLLQPRFRGFFLLALANGTFAIGLFFLGYREILSDVVTIIAANICILSGHALYYEAIRKCFGEERINPISPAIMVVTLVLLYRFTYSAPSINKRIILLSAMGALFAVLSLLEFIRKTPDYLRVPGGMTAVVFAVSCVFQLFRLGTTIKEGQIASFMDAGETHAYALFLMIVLISGSTFGLVWMASGRLEYEMTRLATLDQLTKVLNRRGLEDAALQEFSKLNREEEDLGIIFADIDHFKSLNDRYGHRIGDEVLTVFASLVRKELRLHDIFGRIGGEEFVILLPDTSFSNSLETAERLREMVEKMCFEMEGNEIYMTASFGVAMFTQQANSLEKMISCADKALYHSKREGRNKVSYFMSENGRPVLYTS